MAVRRWAPPFSPSSVIKETADMLRAYGIDSVTLDRFATGVFVSMFQERGITATLAPEDTSSGFVSLLALINSKRVRLLDHPRLVGELRRLERRPGSGGKDRVGHPSGGHDDTAAAAAAALVAAAGEQPDTSLTWGSPGRFIGVGFGNPRRRHHRSGRRISSHNPRVAQDLMDFAEGKTNVRDRGPVGDSLRRQQIQQRGGGTRGVVPDRIASTSPSTPSTFGNPFGSPEDRFK